MTRSQMQTAGPDGRDHTAKPDPAEGLRLLKAFMTIADPRARMALIEFVEQLAKAGATTADEAVAAFARDDQGP